MELTEGDISPALPKRGDYVTAICNPTEGTPFPGMGVIENKSKEGLILSDWGRMQFCPRPTDINIIVAPRGKFSYAAFVQRNFKERK